MHDELTIVGIYKDVVDILSTGIESSKNKKIIIKYTISKEEKAELLKQMLDYEKDECPFPDSNGKDYYSFTVLGIGVEVHKENEE